MKIRRTAAAFPDIKSELSRIERGATRLTEEQIRRLNADQMDKKGVALPDRLLIRGLLRKEFIRRAEEAAEPASTIDAKPFRTAAGTIVLGVIMVGGFGSAVMHAGLFIRERIPFDFALITCQRRTGRSAYRDGRPIRPGRVLINEQDVQLLKTYARNRILLVDDLWLEGETAGRVASRMAGLGFSQIFYTAKQGPAPFPASLAGEEGAVRLMFDRAVKHDYPTIFRRWERVDGPLFGYPRRSRFRDTDSLR